MNTHLVLLRYTDAKGQSRAACIVPIGKVEVTFSTKAQAAGCDAEVRALDREHVVCVGASAIFAVGSFDEAAKIAKDWVETGKGVEKPEPLWIRKN